MSQQHLALTLGLPFTGLRWGHYVPIATAAAIRRRWDPELMGTKDDGLAARLMELGGNPDHLRSVLEKLPSTARRALAAIGRFGPAPRERSVLLAPLTLAGELEGAFTTSELPKVLRPAVDAGLVWVAGYGRSASGPIGSPLPAVPGLLPWIWEPVVPEPVSPPETVWPASPPAAVALLLAQGATAVVSTPRAVNRDGELSVAGERALEAATELIARSLVHLPSPFDGAQTLNSLVHFADSLGRNAALDRDAAALRRVRDEAIAQGDPATSTATLWRSLLEWSSDLALDGWGRTLELGSVELLFVERVLQIALNGRPWASRGPPLPISCAPCSRRPLWR